MLQIRIIQALALCFLTSSCKRRDENLTYSDYASKFQLSVPSAKDLNFAWHDRDKSTFFFEFSIDENQYSELSKILKSNGYSEPESMDGYFGKWRVFSSPEKRVIGQSKIAQFGNTYYFYEESAGKLTAIARYTAGR